MFLGRKQSRDFLANHGTTHCAALPGRMSDRIWRVSVVHLLPHHRPAYAEEIPQVAEDAAVEGVLLVAAVLQVGDAVAGHELPGGAVNRHQVEMAAEQQQHHHGENATDSQRRQQEAVRSEPQLPRDPRGDARPEKK